MQQQAETGIDVVNDGEFGKAMRSAMDYGAWWSYVYARIDGFEVREERPEGRAAWTYGSKERNEFAEFYDAERRGCEPAAGRHQHGAALRPHLHRAGEVHRPRRHQARHRQPRRGCARDASKRRS